MLHAGEDVFDPGTGTAVFNVAGLLDRQQVTTGAFAVWDDHAGTEVGAITHHRDLGADLSEAGFSPRLTVGMVAGNRSANRNHQTGVGIDHLRGEDAQTVQG